MDSWLLANEKVTSYEPVYFLIEFMVFIFLASFKGVVFKCPFRYLYWKRWHGQLPFFRKWSGPQELPNGMQTTQTNSPAVPPAARFFGRKKGSLIVRNLMDVHIIIYLIEYIHIIEKHWLGWGRVEYLQSKKCSYSKKTLKGSTRGFACWWSCRWCWSLPWCGSQVSKNDLCSARFISGFVLNVTILYKKGKNG